MPRIPVPLLGIVICCIAVYHGSVGNEFIYDDHEVIQAHDGPRSLSDVAQLFRERHFPSVPYYRPITRTTLLMQKTVSGENPAPFHLFNIGLAAVAGLLGFAVLRSRPFSFDVWPAWLASAMFVLHPVASSCVYPVSSGRETLMPAVWTLACLYCWLRPGPRWKAAAAACLAGALLSKEQAVIVPLLLLLADALRLPADPPGKSASAWLVRYAPLLAILAAYFAARHALFGGSEYVPGELWGPLLTLAYATQSLVAPFYTLHYEPSLQTWLSPVRLVAALIVFGALIFVYARGRIQKTTGLFWCGWFLIALLPNSNLVRQEAPYDERYLFLASFSVFAVFARVLPSGTKWKAAALCVLAVAGFISASRASWFQDDIVFSRQWLQTEPSSVNAEYNLAYSLARQGDSTGAIHHYRRTLQLRPDYAFAHNNLANVFVSEGRSDQAIPHFQEALRLDPAYFDAWYNLGLALCGKGSRQECIAALRTASELRADRADVLVNLGSALAQSGDLAGAEAAFERALHINPQSPEAHGNYANVLAQSGRFDKAIAHYREALRLNPNLEDAARNLQAVLSLRQR